MRGLQIAFRILLALLALALAAFSCAIVGFSVFVTGPRVESWISAAVEKRTGAQVVFENEGRVKVFPHLEIHLPASRMVLPGRTDPIMRIGPVSAKVSPWATFLGHVRFRSLALESIDAAAWPRLLAAGQAKADSASTRTPASLNLMQMLLRLSIQVGHFSVGRFSGEIPGLGSFKDVSVQAEDITASSVRSLRIEGRAGSGAAEGKFSASCAVDRSGMKFTAVAPEVLWTGADAKAQFTAETLSWREGNVQSTKPGIVALRGPVIASARSGTAQIMPDGSWKAAKVRASWNRDSDRPVAVELRGEGAGAAFDTGRIHSISGTATVSGLARSAGNVTLPLGGEISWTREGSLHGDLVGSVDGEVLGVKARASLKGDHPVEANITVKRLDLENWKPARRSRVPQIPAGNEQPAAAPAAPEKPAAAAPAQAQAPAIAATRPQPLVHGTITAEQVSWRKAAVTGFTGRYEAGREGFFLTESRGTLAGGTVETTLSLLPERAWNIFVKASRVEASDLMQQLGAKPRIEGPADISVGLAGRGSDLFALSGKGSARIATGAWNGISLEKLAEAVQAKKKGLPRISGGKTAIRDASVTFLVHDGVADAQDFRASAEQASLGGTVSWQVASGRVEGSLTAVIDPSGAAVKVPLRITGSASDMRARVDWSGAIASLLGVEPQAAEQAEAAEQPAPRKSSTPAWLKKLRTLFRTTN